MRRSQHFFSPEESLSIENLVAQLDELNEDLLAQLTEIYPFPNDTAQTVLNLKRALIHKLPKTDLHVHGEAGCLIDVNLARTLAARNNVSFPEELVDERNTWKYRGKNDFVQFLNDFLAISALICTPKDIEDVAYAFYKNCYERNVIFALPGISWVQCKDKMTFSEFNEAYNRALSRGMNDFGDVTVMRLRYYLERHIETQPLFAEIIDELHHRSNPLIMTIGLAGAEEGHPLCHFNHYYEGFKKLRTTPGKPWYFLTAHMEAFSDHKTIAEATRILDWIAHGRNAADNSDTVNQLKAKGFMFELCPLSDVDVYPDTIPSLADHRQLLALINAGLVSLNSDDPGFFGDINEVYLQVYETLSISLSQLLACTVRGVNPASPAALQEMTQFNQKAAQDYHAIKQVSELKIIFFLRYYQLLPMLLDSKIERGTQQKILNIDLKTSVDALKQLKEQIPTTLVSLTEGLQDMIHNKMAIELRTRSINETTQAWCTAFEETNAVRGNNRSA